MVTREAVAQVLALIGSALDREIPDATVDAWALVMDCDDDLVDDESLRLGVARLLVTWGRDVDVRSGSGTWMPPPALVMNYAREAKIDTLREQHAALMEGKQKVGDGKIR